jgi:outer membrane receptor protein involved in Fe transport
MYKLALPFLFLLLTTALNAQVTLSGRVADADDKPLAYASIALVGARDSAVIRGALTDEQGAFTIENVAAGEYRVHAALLGYLSRYTAPFHVEAGSQTARADIRLDAASDLLREVTVTATRPLFEQKADRLIVNVANSPVAAGGSALEILQKVPGVLVVQDRITLAGSQSVQIWIDGKPSQYADMNAVLRDLPGDQIDRIELITQPGARYDAAGGAIINIILKRNAELGFTGTVSATAGGGWYDQAQFSTADRLYRRYNTALNLNYRGGRWNLFGSYSYSNRTMFQAFDIQRLIGSERYQQLNYDPFRFDFHSYRFGADFYATKKTTVGVLLRGWQRDGSNAARNVTTVYDRNTDAALGSFTTENNGSNDRSNFAGNLNLRHEFDARSGHALDVDLDYNQFDIYSISRLNIYDNEPGSPESRSEQILNQPIDIWVGQFNYTLPLDSTFKLETGAKASFATIDNDLKFWRGTTLDPGQSNDFLYRENINAAYANVSKTVGPIDLNAGLRTEQTVVQGESMDSIVLDRNYWQLFPSASALYHVGKHFGVQASYSRRVTRPGFQQQNPFAFFIDSLTYQQGNPSLRPETINLGQLGLTYDGQPFVRVSYSRTDDVIVENAPRLEGTRTFTSATNLADYERWAFELNFPVKFKKLIDGFGGNQFILNQYDADYLGERYTRSKWNWLAYAQVNVHLPANFKVELGGWYMTNFLEEFFEIGAMGGFNAGISTSFWDQRAKLTLSASDLLYTQRSRVTVDFADVLVLFNQRNETRNVRLTFSYQFGNTKVKATRKRALSSETETSRVKVE